MSPEDREELEEETAGDEDVETEDEEADEGAEDESEDAEPTSNASDDDDDDFVAPPPRSGGGRRFVWGFVIFIILVVAAVGTWYCLIRLPQQQEQQRIEAQETAERAAMQAMSDVRSLLGEAIEAAAVDTDEAIAKLKKAKTSAETARSRLSEYDKETGIHVGKVRDGIDAVLKDVEEKESQIKALQKEKMKLLTEDLNAVKDQAGKVIIGTPAAAAAGTL